MLLVLGMIDVKQYGFFSFFLVGLCIWQFQQYTSQPPRQPQGICSHCQSQQWSIQNFVTAQGLAICLPQGEPRAFDIRPQHQHKAAENKKKGTGNAKVSQQRKANRCIGLRGKHYFLHNRKQGVFSKQNVENCSFP